MTAALLAVVLAGCSPVTPPRAGGIVSTNPCTDAILAELVPEGRIAAISHYSQDPRASSMDLALAQRLPAIAGTAEEVIARRPDLVLLGSHTPLATKSALARAEVNALYLGVPASIAESRAQVREIARAVGAKQRGEMLVARIDAALSRASGHAPVPAMIWQGGGLVPGAGTLADDMLRAAGFANASAAYGLASWDILPLERVVAHPPRVILQPAMLTGEMGGDARTLATRDRVLAHWGGRVARAEFDESLLFCGGPTIIRALDRLAEVRRTLDRDITQTARPAKTVGIHTLPTRHPGLVPGSTVPPERRSDVLALPKPPVGVRARIRPPDGFLAGRGPAKARTRNRSGVTGGRLASTSSAAEGRSIPSDGRLS